MAGIVHGVAFLNLTGRHFPSVDGLKRNVSQVVSTCSRICSFVCNSGFSIGCAMGSYWLNHNISMFRKRLEWDFCSSIL